MNCYKSYPWGYLICVKYDVFLCPKPFPIIHLSYPFSAFLFVGSLSFCSFCCSSYAVTRLRNLKEENWLSHYIHFLNTIVATKKKKKLTHWCHCQSPQGTPPFAERKGGGIQSASGCSRLGRNKPRSPSHFVSHPHCIPARAGLDKVLDSSVKSQEYYACNRVRKWIISEYCISDPLHSTHTFFRLWHDDCFFKIPW